MTYTTMINDEEITLTEEDSLEATKNDTAEILHKYNPERVSIEEIPPKSGNIKCFRVNIKADTHYLVDNNDKTPKHTDNISFYVDVPHGYPIKPVFAYYPENRYLASVNVYRSGACCTDLWVPFSSTLPGTVDKLIKDAVHCPSVTRYDSAANSDMIEWHKAHVRTGEFPTISLKLLYKPDPPPVDSLNRTTYSASTVCTPPPIPPRRNQSNFFTDNTPPPIPPRRSQSNFFTDNTPPPIPARH